MEPLPRTWHILLSFSKSWLTKVRLCTILHVQSVVALQDHGKLITRSCQMYQGSKTYWVFLAYFINDYIFESQNRMSPYINWVPNAKGDKLFPNKLVFELMKHRQLSSNYKTQQLRFKQVNKRETMEWSMIVLIIRPIETIVWFWWNNLEKDLPFSFFVVLISCWPILPIQPVIVKFIFFIRLDFITIF